MHMYEISNSSCTCSPDLAALWPLIQEILNKMCESSKNAKVYSLSWYHCSSLKTAAETPKRHFFEVQKC